MAESEEIREDHLPGGLLQPETTPHQADTGDEGASTSSEIEELSQQTGPVLNIPTRDYEIRKRREGARTFIAGGLIVLIAILSVLMPSLTAMGLLSSEDSRDFLELTLRPMIPLAAAAVAFYFADR